MSRIMIVMWFFIVGTAANSQRSELNTYPYVIVPNHFDFLKEADQYRLNSMTVFYLEKSGFNAFLSDEAPEGDRCAALYADVEKLSSILGGRLQVVLRDCNNTEIYRSEIGKSKIKDYEKTFQDALRRAFRSIEELGVNQKEWTGTESTVKTSNKTDKLGNNSKNPEEKTDFAKILPTTKFSNYIRDGKSYLLRKTEEGFSLYEENANSKDGFVLQGKIIVMENSVRFLDIDGKVLEVNFDSDRNFTIKDNENFNLYQIVD